MAAIVRRKKGRTRVSAKHQVTIPVAALQQAGLDTGDVLDVTAEHGRVVLSRATDQLEEFFGSMPEVWPPGALDELRNEWER